MEKVRQQNPGLEHKCSSLYPEEVEESVRVSFSLQSSLISDSRALGVPPHCHSTAPQTYFHGTYLMASSHWSGLPPLDPGILQVGIVSCSLL